MTLNTVLDADPTLDEYLAHLSRLPDLDLWDLALGAGSDPVDARLALETLHGRARSRSRHPSTLGVRGRAGK